MAKKCACGCGKTELNYGDFFNLQHCLKYQRQDENKKRKKRYLQENVLYQGFGKHTVIV